MEIHSLGKDGGTLIWNKINSIAQTNPQYATQLERGMAVLGEARYLGVGQ